MKSNLRLLFFFLLIGTIPYKLLAQPCIEPSNLSATNISTTGATLSWTAPSGAVAYTVQYHAPGAAWVNVTTQLTSVTLTNLICGTAYEWHVQSICSTTAGGTSSFTVSNTFTTLPCPVQCLPPPGLTTGNITTTGATLSWTPSAGSFAYIVQYHALTSPASAWISTTTQTPSLTLSNLACGTLYEWHVAAFCNNNTSTPSAYSTPISFTTAACTTPCVAPTGLTTTNISTTGATLSWSAAAGAIGYSVQYHAPGAAWTTVTTQSTSISLTNLICGTAYEWHVATYCTTTANPPGPYSTAISFTTATCPVTCNAPTNLAATNITSTGATLLWVAQPGALAYVVQYHVAGTNTWTNVTVQALSITLTNLICGTVYEWHVQTYCSSATGGVSPYSVSSTFTTLPCNTTCLPPTGLTTTNINTTGATLSWTAAAGAIGYAVQYHAPGAAWINLTTQSTSITLTNLTCGTVYEWHVATYCNTTANPPSPYSAAISFTTLACVPTCVPPTGLLASNITTTGATISWTAVTGAVGYIAQYHVAGSNTWINVTTQSNTATLTNLTCGTVYEWHVATVCGTAVGSTSPYSTSIVFTTLACPVTCNPPATLTTTNMSTTGATLSWTPVTGAIAYVVQYHSSNGAWINVTTQSTSITLTNLACGTVYEWHVATYCNSTANPPSPYSAAISFTTLACVPTCVPPTGLLATNITTTGAVISWTPVAGAVSYVAQYHVAGTNTWINVTSQSNTVTLTNLTCGTVYEWHVATVCGTAAGSISPYSTPIIFTTVPCTTTCLAPTGLTTTNISTTGATLSWTAVTGAIAYVVQYHSANGAWVNVTTQSTSISLTNLTCGTVYEWHVATYCNTTANPPSPYSAAVAFTTLPCNPTCAPPTALTSTNISTTGATLSWTAAAGALGYIVQYHTANGAWINATTQSNSITLTNLTCGTVYEWHVATYCNTTSNPPSPYSAAAVFTTQPCAPTCVPPSGLTATNISITGATLSWIAPAGALGYIVQYHTPGGAWVNITATSTTITLTNLICGTAYEWHVQTLCNTATGSTSPYSVSSTFTTLPCNTTCVAPTALTTGNIGTTSATLTWVAPSPAFAYVVQYHAVTSPAAAWINVTTQTNSVTLTNLICGTTYEWHVQTYCGSAATNLSPFSITVHFTTLPCTTNVCPVPTGLTSLLLSTTGGGSRMLSWNPTGAVSYNIRYRITNSATWLTTTSTGNSKLITGLVPLSNYEWQVQSVCSTASGAASVSAWSPSAFFTTPQARSIFPNPASGRSVQLPIVTQNEARFDIIISDRTGRTVRVINKTIAAGGEFLDINIESLDDGMYFIRVKGNGNNEVQKLFIVR